ncbi:MAG: deoxyguanosinetriphosphate triphosphohydrolase [Deltaproteobacteria bacterium]|nr:deoxyguanosinetriphosphate triphosphohydrolase [Deltaproteobacteria bacterium]MBN2674056.1 deoxyguanosinetriphosphate triphosphohydrolase [Deltaproteobacteria bacterium]
MLRQQAEKREASLSPHAAKSAEHLDTRSVKETPCEVRTAFQRDCHRIVHSKAFRRLRGKTQVFLWPEGDHYRTRMTHCMEVSQIARTLARALNLNEDLTEAIALGHDLGHTAFGHAGEGILQKLHPNGFRHEAQSLRVVEYLERDGRGLNLTAAVRDGIANHSKGAGPLLDVPEETLPRTLEGQIVRLSDLIAYVNHDLDDAIRGKVISPDELPSAVNDILGDTHSGRLTFLVNDVVRATALETAHRITMSPAAADALEKVRDFLYQRVYYNDTVHCEFKKATKLVERLWAFFMSDLDLFYKEYWPSALRDGIPEDDVRDFIAGMTDAFAATTFQNIYTPRRWYIY